MKLRTLSVAITSACLATAVHAGVYFEPLSAPNLNNDVGSFNNAPFALPENYSLDFVASRESLTADFNDQGETYPATFGNWDMLDFGGDNAEFIYIPHEVGDGAGVTRLNRDTGEAVVLLEGIPGSDFDLDPSNGWDHLNDNFGGLDPAVLTPAGTLITAEEWAGGGRLFELANPLTATSPANADWRWLSNFPSVSHEGIQFDSSGNMYFVDENSSGSIYKFVPTTAGDLSHGQTFVMVVDGGNVDGALGQANWVALTDENNEALTDADPFDFYNRGGRAAADELGATGYCRPEDLTVGTLANGNEVISFAATCSNIVYSIELTTDSTATVREYFNSDVTPDAIGNNPVGSGDSDSEYGLDDPDNLATDAAGNIFIIEDENPGDIWQAVDEDKDGVAERVALFASLGQYGSEPTGFKADPRDPFTWYVNIQHPSGQGNNDALWVIKHNIADSCDCQAAGNHGRYVSCVAKSAKEMGIRGSIKSALMDLAANSSCGHKR